MKTIRATVALVLCSAVWGFAAQETGNKAFDHYEAIRLALSTDTLKGVPGHAASLAPLAQTAAGADAKKAAEQLGAAADIKAARLHFGVLSSALLPIFETAQLKDVYFFRCPMVKQSWAQRGKEIQNPYMGKSMAACGVPAKSQKVK